MSNDNLQKLNTFFDKYIDQMLIKDIELLSARNSEFRFSYPYILLTSSCIDLFGGIENGFTSPDGRSNSKERFIWFVREWMGQINRLYKEESLADLIYDSWRCGVSHQATLKKGFETSSYMYPKERHLHYIEDNERIFVHSIQFAEDMIAAQKLYRKYINDNVTNSHYIDSLYQHLMNMIGDNNPTRIANFNQFVQLLQSNHFVFNSSNNTSTTTTTSISSTPATSPSAPITRLPDELLPVVPSAAPNEDDLK
jgi:hypothetical protein